MHVRPDNPLIVQGDGKVLVETKHGRYEEARDFLSRFAELEASPEHLHTYRINPLSLWNAASVGMSFDEITRGLLDFSKFDIPQNVLDTIRDTIERYGLIKLVAHPEQPDRLLRLTFSTSYVAKLVSQDRSLKDLMVEDGRRHWAIQAGHRGLFKQRALVAGWPVEDLAGFLPGAHLDVQLRTTLRHNGQPFHVRDYQMEAARRWYQEGKPSGGCGVVVLACGAGKTIVGMTAMSLVNTKTLILATNQAAVNQWIREILDKTTLTADQVGAYTGESKEIRPVTVATYQILTWRASKEGNFAHLHLFEDEDWGLIIYDEVHLLPAPVFRVVAHLQARRRLGLTATLVREDGKEGDVFALIGPKRFDMPWKDLEGQGWIASAVCTEIRIGFDDEDRLGYAIAEDRERFRVASTNPRKMATLRELLKRHKGSRVLIIGMYVDQLKEIADEFSLPLITGETRQAIRDDLFARFREGSSPVLVISRVGNFSVDLPDANVAIQVSGTWGSRQEEAQRLGRVLRPKPGQNTASFYTIVTRDTVEQEFGEKRQLFLTEQGYTYRIEAEE